MFHLFLVFSLCTTTVYIHLYGVYFLYVLNIVLQDLPNRKYCCTVGPVNSKKGRVGFKRKTALGPYLDSN